MKNTLADVKVEIGIKYSHVLDLSIEADKFIFFTITARITIIIIKLIVFEVAKYFKNDKISCIINPLPY